MFPELITDLLQDGYKVRFNAPGHSMYPTILANETLVVEPVRPSDVNKGDIVLYRSNGGLFAHRVMGVVRDDKADEYSSLLQAFCPEEAQNALETVDGRISPSPKIGYKRNGLYSRSSAAALLFILRGDASPTFDDPVTSEQILGKVISIERNGRSINPDSFSYKLLCLAHKLGSRIKRFFL